MSAAVLSTTTIPLNHTEHAYVGIDGFAGSMIIIYMLQFNTGIEAARVRSVVRELLSAYPRFRGVAEARLHRHRLRILPDGEVTDQLFDIAWREEAHIDAADPAALERQHQQMLNEVLPLEHGLACRFHFVPHAEQPVLFFAVHHLLFDGRSALEFFGDLMKRLNGGPRIAAQALDAPSLVGALAPARWWHWPQHLWRSRANLLKDKRRDGEVHIQQAAPQGHPYLTGHMLRHHTVPIDTTVLRQVARRLGLSLNGLVTLALSEAYLSYAPNDPRAASVIRQSVDLRRYHRTDHGKTVLSGNHVGAFLVTEVGRRSLAERAASIKAQMDEGLARFERREMLWPQLVPLVMPWLGRTLLSRAVTDMQRKGRMPRISCHATSLGNVSGLNPPDAAIRIARMSTVVPSVSTLHVVCELDGRLSMPVVWQRCDATVEQMDDYLRRVDQAFADVVAAMAV